MVRLWTIANQTVIELTDDQSNTAVTEHLTDFLGRDRAFYWNTKN